MRIVSSLSPFERMPTARTAERYLRMTEKLTTHRPVHRVSLSDRWMIAGATGSGKTTLMKRLIKALHEFYPQVPVYILDSKQAGDFTGWPGARWDETAPGPIDRGFQVWQPPVDDPTEYGNWLGKIHRDRRPAIVVIDELSSLAAGHDSRAIRYPHNYALLLKQGRGLSQCVISLTQEAAYIPRQTLNQTTHLIRFWLTDDYDSRKLDQKMGRAKRGKPLADDLNPKHQHGFWYARLDKPPIQAHYYESYELFL
jgi:hypothetical protein